MTWLVSAVGADQHPVARLQDAVVDARLHVGLAADGLLQFVAARVGLGLLRRQRAQLHQAIDQRLVARQLDQPALVQVIGPAVADVADDDVAAVDVDDLGRAAHAAPLRRRCARGGEDLSCWPPSGRP